MSEALYLWITLLYMEFVALASVGINYQKRINALKERRIEALEKDSKEYLDQSARAINTAYQAVAERDYYRAQTTPFSAKEINQLIRLCHPDKHGNSELATEMTKKLLKLKNIT